MRYPLVRDLAAGGIPIAVTCRVLGLSRQAFYAWRQNPVSQRDGDEAHLNGGAVDIHADDPAFGYRFIADELPGRGYHRRGEHGRPAVLPAGHLAGVQQETRPGQESRPAGA
jgi:putative transposase